MKRAAIKLFNSKPLSKMSREELLFLKPALQERLFDIRIRDSYRNKKQYDMRKVRVGFWANGIKKNGGFFFRKKYEEEIAEYLKYNSNPPKPGIDEMEGLIILAKIDALLENLSDEFARDVIDNLF